MSSEPRRLACAAVGLSGPATTFMGGVGWLPARVTRKHEPLSSDGQWAGQARGGGLGPALSLRVATCRIPGLVWPHGHSAT